MGIAGLIKGPRRIRRVAHIARTSARLGLGFLVSRLNLQRHLPAWMRMSFVPAEPAVPEDLPARFARLLEELGPTFVKLGQMLASRPDILPATYIEELKRICHHVMPFPSEVALRIIEEDLGKPASELFPQFSEVPRASASMAQVHDAELPDGTPVVVKVRRPGIERIIDDDVAIMRFLAEQADNLEEFKALCLPVLVEEFGEAVKRELDFATEAAHTHRFFKCFREERRLVVPEVYWEYSSERVLTLKRITGTHMTVVDQLPDYEQRRSRIARTILDVFLQQFFKEGLFHADPHPGNVLVLDDDRIGLIDYGMVGNLSLGLRNRLGVFVMAVSSEQFELAAEVVADLGSIAPSQQRDEFQQEIVRLLERHYSMPIEKMDFQRTFMEVMQAVRKYSAHVPRDFVLLGKSLATIAGLVLQLDPGLNFAELVQPYGKKLMLQSLSWPSMRRSLSVQGYHLTSLLRSAPQDLRRILHRFQEGLFEFRVKHEGLRETVSDLDRAGNRLALSIILASMIVASSMLLSTNMRPVITLFGGKVSLLGLAGLTGGVVLGAWLILGIFRSGRL